MGNTQRESSGWSTPDAVRVWEGQEELHVHLSSYVTCVIQRQLFKKKGLRLEGEKGLWVRSPGKAAAGHRGMKQHLVQEAGATGAVPAVWVALVTFRAGRCG